MTLRIGLVRAGYWVALQHAPMHNPTTAGAKLVGVWAREQDLAATLAAKHGIACCRSYEELLDICDAVDFAIPPAPQAELAMRAARAGKHLLLEKPLAGNLADARRLAETVEAQDVKSVMGLTRRFHPRTARFMAEAQNLAAEGTIMGAQGTFLHNSLLKDGFLTPGTWRSRPTGPLLDLGAHLIDIAMAALGPAHTVRASGGQYTTVELRHTGGAISQLAVSMHVQSMPSVHELHMYGTTGIASFSKSGISDAECWQSLCCQLARAVELD